MLGQSGGVLEHGLLRQRSQLHSWGHTESPRDPVLPPLQASAPLWMLCLMRLACRHLHLALLPAACTACHQGAGVSPDSRKVNQ